MGQLNIHSPTFCEENKDVNRENYILDTLSIEYKQEAFTHVSRIFHRMCAMRVGKSA